MNVVTKILAAFYSAIWEFPMDQNFQCTGILHWILALAPQKWLLEEFTTY